LPTSAETSSVIALIAAIISLRWSSKNSTLMKRLARRDRFAGLGKIARADRIGGARPGNQFRLYRCLHYGRVAPRAKPVLQYLFARKDLVSRQLVDDVLKYKRLDVVKR
jgi:hypothetical protein